MIPETLRSKVSARAVGATVLGASLLFNLVLVLRDRTTEDEDPLTYAPVPTVSNAPVPAEQVAPLPERKPDVAGGGNHIFRTEVRSSLSAAFGDAPGTRSAALSAVYARLFVWDIDLRRSLQKGDRVDVAYEQPADPCPERTRREVAGEDLGPRPPECNPAEPVVLAARLHNRPGEAGSHALAAYRWQAPGDMFPSYWNELGYEVPRRLIDGPLTDYEQIISLLKDRPKHAGMDFKAPVGTPVITPRQGTVTRLNWNQPANGNCVEVKFPDGTLAKFLHLNENLVKVGQSVSAGTVIGKVGNTGHSFGPHLHYQLERGGSVIDPTDYHGVLRRQLPSAALEAFAPVRKDYETMLDGRVAVR